MRKRYMLNSRCVTGSCSKTILSYLLGYFRVWFDAAGEIDFRQTISKGSNMQEKYTYGLWGAAAGAAALAIVGFTWGGWYTSKGALQHAQAAVLTALVPACVKEVMADPTAIAELKVKRTTDYDDVVRDYRSRVGGLADLGYQFNRDCGRAIEAALAKPAPKS
jgi:hypothetical protein